MKKWVILFFLCLMIIGCTRIKNEELVDFTGKNIEEIKKYAEENHITLKVEEENSDEEKGKILKQIPSNGKLTNNLEISIIISKGKEVNYKELGINELGDIPIMMYHGIQKMNNDDTSYIGGNIDKDGYQRTSEAFINDLEFYYQNNYRMIRLIDYVDGKIDVELGKSPIILTFDDGKNNINILDITEKGELIIDPDCAVGILESFKEKYPDYNVTATFFVNGWLFESEYNEEILKWLVNHGYDIGNHSYTHADFSKISEEEATNEIGRLYALLDTIIPNKYVPIVALPFGSPYNKEHDNFNHILNSSYENKNYETIATLRVGWEASSSPFVKDFDYTFLKRIRAYDNNGLDFDIEMNFKILEENRYISDGDSSVITIPKELENNIENTSYQVLVYE